MSRQSPFFSEQCNVTSYKSGTSILFVIGFSEQLGLIRGAQHPFLLIEFHNLSTLSRSCMIGITRVGPDRVTKTLN